MEPSAHADEPTSKVTPLSPSTAGTLRATGYGLVAAGGLALLPAAWTAGTVAVGTLEPGGAERAAKDFQEPYVFVPLASGFAAIMIGVALIVVSHPLTDKSSPRALAQSRIASPLSFEF